MVSDKTIRFANKNIDLSTLSCRIIDYLNREGYETKHAEGFREVLIQARKESILKNLAMSNKCLTVLLLGQPDDFSVRIGIGRCFQKLTPENIESIVSFGVFLGADIPEAIWDVNIEKTIIKNIIRMAEGATKKI